MKLLDLGLRVGDTVRFRPHPSARWVRATVVGRERDGSVGVRDARGASRSLQPERLELRTQGPRGAMRWEPVVDRAARAEQLDLFVDVDPAVPEKAARPGRRR